MKRELTAVALLLLLLAISLANLRYYDRLTDEIESELRLSRLAVERNDFPAAKEAYDRAEKSWLRADSFTNTLLRHTEVDAVTDGFFELKGLLDRGEQSECPAVFDKLFYHLDCIDGMEHARLGSIF